MSLEDKKKVAYMATHDKKFIIVEGEAGVQGSDAWKEFKRDKVGGSEIAAILGESPWETKLNLFKRKLLGKELPVTDAMQRGSKLEAQARNILNKQMGKEYKPVVVQSVKNPSLIASLDGFYVDEFGEVHIIEIKCPGKESHERAKKGCIPNYYIPQLCYQCLLTDARSCLYVSWDGESDCVEIVEFRPDKFLLKMTEAKVNLFLKDLNDFNPPEEEERDWIRENSEELIARANRYEYLLEMIEELTSEMKYHKEKLISGMNHPKTMVGNLKIQKIKREGTVDYAKIPELKGLDLQKYRKQGSEYWNVTIV